MRNVHEEETRHKLTKLCALRLSFHKACSLISYVSSAQHGITNVLLTILFCVYLQHNGMSQLNTITTSKLSMHFQIQITNS